MNYEHALNLKLILIHLTQFAAGTVICFDFHKFIKRSDPRSTPIDEN